MVQLRIPGPTPCPPEVLQAMAWPMINHRGPEYKKMHLEVTEKVKAVFQTSNDVYLLTGSGTGRAPQIAPVGHHAGSGRT